ncbi:MAG: hypothetical protein R3B49_10570 [Phycisphaerales bacterium]
MTKGPKPAPDAATLPSAVTFFMNAGERRRVLAALRAIDDDRARALLIALGLKGSDTNESGVRAPARGS